VSAEETEGAVEYAQLTYVEMGIVVELPTGWELQADQDGTMLVCVAGDDWTDDGYAPSITIQRDAPLADEDHELQELADTSLERIQGSYDGFELLWARRDGNRAIRAYEYHPQDLGRRVVQVQGIVADVGTYVVTGTTPLVHTDPMVPVFEHVIASLRPSGD
jgi:hypothetical protein